MYIKEVKIKNFRNFKDVKIPLNKFTILIGENDGGKSNLIRALQLVLNNKKFEYVTRTLGITDFNSEIMDDFFKKIVTERNEIEKALNDDDTEYINNLIPIIDIELTFTDASDDYQKALLSDWLNEEPEGECYNIKYIFAPKDGKIFLRYILDLSQEGKQYMFPIELYEYKVVSSNNGKSVRLDKFQNFNINSIGAERDNFSENNANSSYKLVSSLINKSLSITDKSAASQAYNEFFEKLKELESFKEIFKKFEENEFDNWRSIANELTLGPNVPNLKSIFSNINITYGDEFLYQKGLGTRNLILIMLLFTNYLNDDRKFNVISVEELEAHMCINNLNIAMDFISKSYEKLQNTKFNQIIITSHNYNVINKLRFDNVVVLNESGGKNFSEYKEMSKYLAKRPNFDILKILFSKRIILVEGPSEEMLINTYLEKNKKTLYMGEVIVTGKGYRKFLDIWKNINDNSSKKIGIVRDYDNQPNAKKEHEEYDDDKNIFVRTTSGYTLEDDIISTGENESVLKTFFKDKLGNSTLQQYMRNDKNKTENMYELCEAWLENKIQIELPCHIKEIIEKVCK